jgi:hypothetical protein
MNTEPNTEPEVETFFEVNFTFLHRKECTAIIRAKTRAEAEAAVEFLNSDVLEYGPNSPEDFHVSPTCEYEEETVEEVSAYGPLKAEDL